MRLDKFICHHTGISRADAKRVLRQELVTLDDNIIKDAGFKVTDDMNIALEGRPLGAVKPRYFMLNKMANTLCSTLDEEYPSVLSYMELPNTKGLHIAGRLDVDTTGLVLITDDGQWSHQITSPKKACMKRYRVWLAEPLIADAEARFTEGVQLHNEPDLTKPAILERITDTLVLLSISEGKYHQVKRMFAAVDNKVMQLHREQIGDIELDPELEEGEWRELTDAEIDSVWQNQISR